MYKKIIGILIMMLLITTALSATGATNIKTLEYLIENNELEPNTSIQVDSNGNIAIKIVGEVTDVDDPHNLLGGVIKVGDKIKGKYNYDSGTPDSNSDPNIGIYEHTSSTYGIELEVGGLVFETNPNNVNYLIGIINNHYYYNYGDFYAVVSYNNLQLSNGMQVMHIIWYLLDSTGNAITSDALPTTAPVLSDWDENEIQIIGYDPSNPYDFFVIEATVTKASLSRSIERDVVPTNPIFIWCFERFPNAFPILRQLLGL